VAQLLRDKLIALRPAHRAAFEARYAAFRQRLVTALLGAALAQKYDVDKLLMLIEQQQLDTFLQAQGDAYLLVGWLAAWHPMPGSKQYQTTMCGRILRSASRSTWWGS
jgi:hypothetical protein